MEGMFITLDLAESFPRVPVYLHTTASVRRILELGQYLPGGGLVWRVQGGFTHMSGTLGAQYTGLQLSES